MSEEDKIIKDIVARDIKKLIKNKGEPMTAKERIIKRYKREVMAHPDGAIVHHGDCDIYHDVGICTCGLHHDLLPMDEDDIKELYPKLYEEMANTTITEIVMREFHDKLLFQKCHNCSGTGCTKCNEVGMVKFKPPVPPTDEEVNKAIKDMEQKYHVEQ